MNELNASIRGIPIPLRMLKLPVAKNGYPIPWFVAYIDGEPDFRVIGPDKIAKAVFHKRCWLCGGVLGGFKVFTIGPMCTVNRVSAEPPSHLMCAEYAVRACPFLTKPKMRRNEVEMPEGHIVPAGFMIKRNPGVTALWVTKKYKLLKDGDGVLFMLGEPERVDWYAHGRAATRAEVDESIATGLPALEDVAKIEGPEAEQELAKCIARSKNTLPAV